METIFTFIKPSQEIKNPPQDGRNPYRNNSDFILKKLNVHNMEPIALSKKTKAPLRSLYLFMALLVAGFLFLTPGAQGQTVNKRLYLKEGETLNRVVPTNTTHQSTIGLFKQTAVLENTSTGKTFPPGNGSISPLNIPHTTGSGTGSGLNRLMLVTIVSDPATINVSSVTYGGVSLTKLDDATNGTNIRTEIWFLKQPATGTADVLINWNPNNQGQMIAGVSTFYDVNQESPFGPVSKRTANTANSSINVSSNAGDLIFDAIGNLKTAFTAVAGQTVIYNETSNKLGAASSRKTGTAGSTSMSWTFSAQAHAHIGVAVKGNANKVDFTQTPSLCSDLILPAGQTISITAYATATTALSSASKKTH